MNRMSKMMRVAMGGLKYGLDLDFSGISDGAITSLTGSTWSVSGGKAINNPSLVGGEFMVNGDFEGSFTGGMAASWTKWYTTFTPTQETTLKHGGSNAQRITAVDGTHTIGVQQSVTTLVRHHMALLSGWVYFSSSRTYELYTDGLQDQTRDMTSVPATTYTRMVVAGRVNSGSIGNINHGSLAAANNEYNIFDDVSLREETMTSLCAVTAFGSAYGSASAKWTKGAFTACPMGVCMNYSLDGLNGVFGYYDDGKVKMDKRVNGTWTQLVSVAAAYVADASVKLARVANSNTYRVYYGTLGSEVQKGTDQTVGDTTITYNRYHGLYDTSPQLNTCTRFIYNAEG